MNRSVIIAASMLLVLLAYFGIRSVMRGDSSVSDDASTAAAAQADDLTEVIVSRASVQPHPVMLKISGRTAPDRTVTVKSGTTGTVISTPAAEGSFVKRGAVLCSLDVEARSARVQEAEALLASAKIEFNAARTLADKGLSPENRVAAAQAQVDVAEAGVNAAKVELAKTRITAPFSGVFETRMAEAGDFLAPGAPCGLLVDLSPLIFTAEVAEDYASRLSANQTGEVSLAGGGAYPAKIRYISRAAREATRTFLVEAEIDTGDLIVPAGLTAEFRISLDPVPATLVSPAQLTLATDGTLGIRYLSSDDVVRFAPVTIIDDGPSGAWITGVPEAARIVTVGQEYLSEGLKVKPVERAGGQP